ncbi:MAG TPA: PDZ domain-containing protein [Rubrivivax sp.]|nr:PDZ domain-containing protein [Rubrivivax sp.]
MIDHLIEAADTHAHLFRITLKLPRPAAQQRVSLPVWIPGSYLVREFSRHLSRLQARQGTRACRIEQHDKCTWTVYSEGAATLQLVYEVYAYDLSVRTAFLDEGRGFFNGSSVFLRVDGRHAEPQRLRIAALPPGWQVATAMPTTRRRHEYLCADYDELVDHPVELGRFWRGEFKARGVRHELVVAGAWPSFDGERLLADARRICDTQIGFWHGRGKAPMSRYLFLLNAVDEGYGGLEHRCSTALISARRHLPRKGVAEASDGYVTLLGLISHEYFHAWNVKRLKPRDFESLDYGRENYTRLLWFFEGFTSYYDDLLLLRAGLVDAPRYLRLLGKTLNGVLATPGRKLQSVAQASFDAWVKYYRGDENTPNATISYYTKGSLVALALDLSLRGAGRGSLDEVMRTLWSRSAGGAIDEDDIAHALQQVAGRSMQAELAAWVHGTDDLPLPPLLARAGVLQQAEATDLAGELGLRVSEGALSGIHVKTVHRGSAAERAGVSAGDELLAVDGWRVRRLDDARAWAVAGQAFELTVVRDQRLRVLRVQPDVPAPAAARLKLADKPTPAVQALRREWLGV